ncbi:hypothetical protein MIZ01_1222 [Sideroxyarcus emersonii]|uniref:Uncharacterized protein n=1 Tax=Sideroxyarcus emersonii TaxID=2764705 RepID=A0AAN2BYR9_9PROT|nr:hypothetical protein MIZ01_1222 [Sideroxyarcus emersonii]
MAFGAAIAFKQAGFMMQEEKMGSLLFGMLVAPVLTLSLFAAMTGAVPAGLRVATARTKPARRNRG